MGNCACRSSVRPEPRDDSTVSDIDSDLNDILSQELEFDVGRLRRDSFNENLELEPASNSRSERVVFAYPYQPPPNITLDSDSEFSCDSGSIGDLSRVSFEEGVADNITVFIEDGNNTCSICTSAYDDEEHVPQILPCGHTFCSFCVRKMVRKHKLALKCPMDRKVHRIKNTERELPTAFNPDDDESIITSVAASDGRTTIVIEDNEDVLNDNELSDIETESNNRFENNHSNERPNFVIIGPIDHRIDEDHAEPNDHVENNDSDIDQSTDAHIDDSNDVEHDSYDEIESNLAQPRTQRFNFVPIDDAADHDVNLDNDVSDDISDDGIPTDNDCFSNVRLDSPLPWHHDTKPTDELDESVDLDMFNEVPRSNGGITLNHTNYHRANIPIPHSPIRNYNGRGRRLPRIELTDSENPRESYGPRTRPRRRLPVTGVLDYPDHDDGVGDGPTHYDENNSAVRHYLGENRMPYKGCRLRSNYIDEDHDDFRNDRSEHSMPPSDTRFDLNNRGVLNKGIRLRPNDIDGNGGASVRNNASDNRMSRKDTRLYSNDTLRSRGYQHVPIRVRDAAWHVYQGHPNHSVYVLQEK